MNANELADAMEIRASIRRKATSRKSVTEGANDRLADQLDQAATMLRQQQAEIEALKAGKIRAYDNGVEDGRKPNTHPVNPYQSITNTKIEPTVVSYTHPVKEHDIGISHAIGFDDGFKAGMQRAVEMNVVKELTDEEIKAVYGEYFDVENCDWLHLECIRAILRKAQEK